MALFERLYTLSIELPYHQVSTFCHGDLAAASIFILLLSAPLLLLCHMSFIPAPTVRATSSQAAPLWLRLILLLDPDLEYPMIFACHPAILINSNPSLKISTQTASKIATFPTAQQLLFQTLIFLAVELLLQICVLRNIKFQTEDDETMRPLGFAFNAPPSTTASTTAAAASSISNKMKGSNPDIHIGNMTPMSMEDDDLAAERLVVDFIRPRGTLLLAIAILAIRGTALEKWTGRLHPLAMVLWVGVRQVLEIAGWQWEVFGKLGLGL